MPPRRRLDSSNVQTSSRYNFRPRTRVVQSSINGSINDGIQISNAIPQRRTTNSRQPNVSIASTHRNNTVPTRNIDQTSIEYMYDRCDDVFYTPERCVYNADIPCYTRYNNVIPLNERYIRHDMPSNDCYMHGTQRITSLSDHYTSILPHRTPPQILSDALYYTIDDILRPIRSYITSTQLIYVVFVYVILSISINWRLYNESCDFIKHITTPPYYWLCLCILYIPMQWYLLFIYYLMNMLYHVVILVLYVIYQAVLNIYHWIYRNICFRVTEHMNAYVIPFVFKCYLWVYIQQPSYVLDLVGTWRR